MGIFGEMLEFETSLVWKDQFLKNSIVFLQFLLALHFANMCVFVCWWLVLDSSRSNTPSTPPSSRWSERILRRLARCLQDIWVDIAYEMEWRSPQVDSTRSKTGGNNVDACFIVLQHWSSANSSSASLLSLLRDAGFQNQADEVEDIVGECCCQLLYLHDCSQLYYIIIIPLLSVGTRWWCRSNLLAVMCSLGLIVRMPGFVFFLCTWF